MYTSEKPGDIRYTKSDICAIVSFYCLEFIVLLSKGQGSLMCYLWRNPRLAIHLVHGAPAEKSVKVLDKLACEQESLLAGYGQVGKTFSKRGLR